MEDDVRQFELDEAWILPEDDVPPVVIIDPPRDEPPRLPPRPKRHQREELQVGPWFPLAMAAFVVLGVLSMATTGSTGGGMALSAAIAVAFGTIYVGFFLVGSFWFEGHRRR